MAAAEDDVLRHLLDAALLHPTRPVPIHSFQVRSPAGGGSIEPSRAEIRPERLP